VNTGDSLNVAVSRRLARGFRFEPRLIWGLRPRLYAYTGFTG